MPSSHARRTSDRSPGRAAVADRGRHCVEPPWRPCEQTASRTPARSAWPSVEGRRAFGLRPRSSGLALPLPLSARCACRVSALLEAEFWPTFWAAAGTWSILSEAPRVPPRVDRARRRVAGEEASATRAKSPSSRVPSPGRFFQERAFSEPAEKLGTPSTPAGTPRSIIRPQLLQPFPFTVRTRIGLCRLLRCRPSRLDLSALDIGLGRFAHATRFRSDVAPAGGLNSRVPLLKSLSARGVNLAREHPVSLGNSDLQVDPVKDASARARRRLL